MSIIPEITVEVVQPEITVTTAGPTGPTGAPGPRGGSISIEQETASSTWTLNHGLGYYPNVTIIDSLGRMVIAPISYPDVDTVQITFTAPFSGTAHLS